MAICIPKSVVEKLKKSALRGEVNIKQLYEMSSSERREFFAKYTDKELGKFINTEFEKAMVAKQQGAIKKWAETFFSPVEKMKPTYKNVLDKINNLKELGVLSPKTESAFLEDLVADKLGAYINPKEIEAISEKAEKIDNALLELGENLGNPEKLDENLAFFQAQKEMSDYLNSLVPASNLRILTGTIGRGMMLFSIKSPILNIGSNVEIGFAEALSRRLANRNLVGTDNKLAVDYVKMVNKIYTKTGYDLSRMTSLADSGASGERVLGETIHTQGEGAVRKAGQVVENIVFKNLMGAPDVAFASAHFADSVNLNAMLIANGDKELASKIMLDAMRIKPNTLEGEILRNQAILDAETATWTNDTWASKLTTDLRKAFNKLSGDARLGDYLFPFIKTPANVIATGMDYAGLGIPKALFKLRKAIKLGELGDKQTMQSIARDVVRSGLGLVGALIISLGLDDDDFVGAYDPSRAQIEKLRNSNYNAIRIGNKWISTDWLGPLAVPVTSMMYARKYGKRGWGERIFQYGKGVGSSVLNLPVISDAYDFVKSNAYKKNQSLEEMTGETIDYLTEEAYSRLVPSFMSDMAKSLDKYERQGGKGLAGVKTKLPLIRQTLPEKRNIFGEKIKTESPISIILAGSRIKTDKEDDTIKEINRVSMAVDKGITFTDWDKSSSLQLAQFKEKKGADVYEEAKVRYGEKLKEKVEKEIKSSRYKRKTDEEKLDEINKLDTEAMKETFKKYNFRYKTKK